MQNDMPMTTHTSKSKPEIECQYGGRPFSEIGSSFILAVDWDMSSKFGMQIDFHLLKQIPSLNLNLEVDFRLQGHNLEKLIWRHYSADDRLITTKFGKQKQNDMPLTIHTSNSKPKIEFPYGGYPFSETGSSFISALYWAVANVRISNGRISKTRRRRSVLCGQTLKQVVRSKQQRRQRYLRTLQIS